MSQNHKRDRRPGSSLPKPLYNKLGLKVAEFAEALRGDPELGPAIKSQPQAFRRDLRTLETIQFKLPRGRRPNALLDKMSGLIEQGKTTTEALKECLPGWDTFDAEQKNGLYKIINQACKRRRNRNTKTARTRPHQSTSN